MDEEQTKEYKHELIDAEHIINDNMAPIQFMEQEIPAFKSMGKYPIRAQQLPKLSIVSNVAQTMYKDCVNITLFAYPNMAPQTYVIPRDMKLRKLTGEQSKKMIEKYHEYRLKNIAASLNTGCQIGSDFEIFVEDKNHDVIPAYTFLGDKSKPEKFDGDSYYGRQGSFFHDDGGFGVSARTAPGGCLAHHVDSSHYGLSAIFEAAKKKHPGAKLSIRSAVELPYEVLKDVKDEHKQSNAYPVINIYGLEGDRMDPLNSPYRFASGDIHFGLAYFDTPRKVEESVKALDAILGVCCVSLFRNLDNPVRRQYVGLPGDYRLPKHGLEYKVLSNAWVLHPFLQHIVFDLSRKSMGFGFNGLLGFWKGSEKETQEAIMNCDYVKAQEIMERNKSILLQMFNAIYGYDAYAQAAYNTFYNGADSVIKDINDIEGAWCLNKSRGPWLGHSEQKWCNGNHGFKKIISGEKI
jgi:hypothetical protein